MIKKVINWGGNNKGGRIYVPKEYVGRLVSIKLLTKNEEKEYKDFLKKQELIKKEREESYEKHITNLRKLREVSHSSCTENHRIENEGLNSQKTKQN